MEATTAAGPAKVVPDRGSALITLTWVLTALASVTVALRISFRAKVKQFGWDDFFMVMSMLCFFGWSVTLTLYAFRGGTRHIWHVALLGADNMAAVQLLNWTSQVFGIMGVAAGKISVSALLLAIIRQTEMRWQRVYIWAITITLASVIAVSCSILTFAQCSPPRRLWDQRVDGHCIDPFVMSGFGTFTGSFNMFADGRALLDDRMRNHPDVISTSAGHAVGRFTVHLARQPGSKYLRKASEIAKDLGNKTFHPVPEPKPLVAKKPSWWFNRQYNTVVCLFYRLPDELLLEICRNLEGSDVYIARQTCSSFRRVLDDEEFLAPDVWRMQPASSALAPKLGVDWDDVHERLRRRGCCSACIDARIPKKDGSGSDFDTTMLELANETQYCTACHDWHPLIMFSHSQRKSTSPLPPSWPRDRSSRRNRKKGAVCIMSEGSVRICPHYSVNLRVVRDRRDEIFPHVGGAFGQPVEPLTLNCEDCFQEMEEPLRSAALRPTATFRATQRDIDGVIGKAYVYWSLPLKVGIDTVLEGDWKALQKRAAAGDDEPRSSEEEELEGALAKAAETYNDLLCPHVRFDDGHTLQDFASHAEEIMYDFRKGYNWIVRLGKNGFYHQNEAGDTRLTDERNICKVCSRWLRPRYGRKLEYIWTLGEKHGLRLHRQLELSVPAFDSQFQVLRRLATAYEPGVVRPLRRHRAAAHHVVPRPAVRERQGQGLGLPPALSRRHCRSLWNESRLYVVQSTTSTISPDLPSN
ncbi:hypothetical protein PG988_006162 [Apiospora saccharicola]